jgi:hypothetical protein
MMEKAIVKEKFSVKESFKMFAIGLGYIFYYFGKVCFKILIMFGKLSIEIGKFSWEVMENMNKSKKKTYYQKKVSKRSNPGKKKKKSSKNNKKRSK